jgi:hypothetical protein
VLRNFLLLCLVAGAAACAPSSGGGADASAEHSITGANPEAGPDGGAEDASPSLMTTVRVAQLSRDVGAVDICYRSVLSQTFTGPVFSSPIMSVGDAGSGDASSQDASAVDGSSDGGNPTLDGGADAASDVTDDSSPPTDAAAEAGPDSTATDATATDATVTDATVTDATLRDAAPDVAPPEEAGPERDATTDAAMHGGGSAGLTYLQVSNYVTIMGAGTFEIVVVPGGQGTCTNAIIDRMVTLDDGKRGTLAIYGSPEVEAGSPNALAMVAMVDDAVAVASSTRTRFFDSAAADSADAEAASALLVSVVGMPTLELEVVLPDSAPGPSATPPTADALGYHTDAPVMAPARLRLDRYTGAVMDGGLDASAPVWLGSPMDLRLVAGSIHTGFLVRDTSGDFAILWCDDTSFGSALSACALVVR